VIEGCKLRENLSGQPAAVTELATTAAGWGRIGEGSRQGRRQKANKRTHTETRTHGQDCLGAN